MSAWSRAERYRATALRLRQLVERMHSTEGRLQALTLARQFETLAQHVERGDLRARRHRANVIPFRRAS